MNNHYQYNYDTFRLQQAERIEKARQQQQAQDLLTQLNAERNQGCKEKPKRH